MANTNYNYSEEHIRTLDWIEHMRMRPGMYIGKLGDGSSPDDGIYILVKEVIDNAIDEYMMGYGKRIDVTIDKHQVTVRDFGRGIPLGKVIECVSVMNTGAKYDTAAFQKSVGLNGVGTKAVNALSQYFRVEAYREGKTKVAEFEKGLIKKDSAISKTEQKDGTYV
ncbi:MAG TPA: ATP-binding protein, partial [Chitinophagales bacterium]|nr:ATP-binding protein [Chitinophagales bacterium]